MTFNLILNLVKHYLTVCYNYSKNSFLTDVFQSLIKDVIIFKDTLLKNNNKLSNKFVTNLDPCKKFKKKK